MERAASQLVLAFLFFGGLGCGAESPAPVPVPAGTECRPAETDGASMAALVETFATGSYFECEAAARDLADFGPGALPVLTRGLSDGRAGVRRWCAVVCKDLGPEAAPAVDALARGLVDPELAEAAAAALAAVGSAALPALRQALRGKEPAAVVAAASALASMGGDALPALPDLAPLLAHPDMDVRAAAAFALGAVGPEAVPVLRETLGRGDENEREAAAMAMGRLGEGREQVTGTLCRALDDASEYVRAAAEGALARIGAPALPDLRAALREGPSRRSRAAARILGTLDPAVGRTAAKDLETALAKEDDFLRIEAAASLLRVAGDDRQVAAAVAALGAELRGAGPDVRLEAARKLGRAGPRASAAVPALAESLEDEDSHVRFAAAEALGRMGPAAKAALPALREMAARDEAWVRPAASLAVRRIAGE